MRSFGSDNHSGIHPKILQAIQDANVYDDLSYGDDQLTKKAEKEFQNLFGDQSKVLFVFNGTGANMLSLSACVQQYQSIIAAQTAHINVDECGAPERQLGCKLITIQTPDGKLTPEMILPLLHGFGDQHHSQPRAVSITQPTEVGTLYTLDEIRAISELVHSHGMVLHMDGARFANAVAALNVEPREIVKGVDILSFGGTKNGLMIGDAVVVLNPELQPFLEFKRKQMLQLYSKMRFVAAQFLAYFKDDLWLEMARHSNAMAKRLSDGVSKYVHITQKTEANGVFAILPQPQIDRLMEKYFFYVWDENTNEVRWMTHFNTSESDVDKFIETLKEIME